MSRRIVSWCTPRAAASFGIVMPVRAASMSRRICHWRVISELRGIYPPVSRPHCGYPRLADASPRRQMIAARHPDPFPDRAGESRRSHPDFVIPRPAPPGEERHGDDELPTSWFTRRAHHLGRWLLLPVQVAAVAELAIRPVVAGTARPALTATGVALVRRLCRCHLFLLYPLYRSRGVEEEGQTLRAREEIARAHMFQRSCQLQTDRRHLAEPPRAFPFDFRPEASEAERVITIGANLATVLKSRP